MYAVAFFDSKASSNTGKVSGTVTFFQFSLKHKTVVDIKLTGFKPNTTHGIHVHSWGDLTKGCASSCAHLNLSGNLHGSMQYFGSDRHEGDLCNNITADQTGNVNFSYQDELIDLSSQYSIVGRMVVIHADPDDMGVYRDEDSKRGEGSRTTGNAGARIACAVIGLADHEGCSN